MLDIIRMEKLRKDKGMTQKNLCKKIGCSFSMYQKWLHPSKDSPFPSQPSIEKLCALADVLGCSTDYILGRSDYLTIETGLIASKTGLEEQSVAVLLANQKETEVNKAFNAAVKKSGAMITTNIKGDNPVADTISFILSPDHVKRGQGGLVHLLHAYLSSPEKTDNTITIPSDNGASVTLSSADLLRGALVSQITETLAHYRTEYRRKRSHR